MSDRSSEPRLSDGVKKIIEKTLANIRYGSITLIIQDGRVVQIENTEKIRTDKN